MRPNTHLIAAIGLGVTTLAVLLSMPSFQQTGDSVAYAISVKTGEQLFHPHHLLFSPIVRVFYLVLGSVTSATAVAAAQVHNAIWAALGVAGMYRIGQKLSGSLSVGIGAAGLLLAAQGYLRYASQVEVYVPATACLVLLVAALVERWPELPDPGWDWGISMLLAMSVLYHQTNVLFCIPLAVFFLWGGQPASIVRFMRTIGLAGGVVLAIYVVVYLAGDDPVSISGFADFCLRYAATERPWGNWSNYSAAGATSLFGAQLWDWILISSLEWTGLVAAFAAVLSVAGLWNGIRAVRLGPEGRMRALAIAWLITYYAFFLWWQPGQPEFYVVTLVPLVVLLTTTLTDLPAFGKHAAVRSLAGLVLATVSIGVLLPYHVRGAMLPAHRTPSRFYHLAAGYAAIAPEGCLLLANRPLRVHMEYYFGVDRLKFQRLGRLRRFLAREGEPVAEKPIPSDRCVVVPLRDVLIVHNEKKGSSLERFEFLRWMFRLEPDTSGNFIEGPVVSRLTDRRGSVYLVQDVERNKFEDMQDFCRAIDRVSGLTGRRESLESWFLDRRDELVQAGGDPLFTGLAKPAR